LSEFLFYGTVCVSFVYCVVVHSLTSMYQ